MRVVVQRISQGQVTVGGSIIGSVGTGLCVFLGVTNNDEEADAERLIRKITQLRIFEDEQGKMNRSVVDVPGEILVVPEFTLYGDCSKGHRPSFSEAAPAPQAERLYNYFVQRLKSTGLRVATGRFQAKMDVAITNDGPVTLILED